MIKQRKLAILTILCLINMFYMPTYAAVKTSGLCGDSLKWSVNATSYGIGGDTLTISGEGDMWDYRSSSIPWGYYKTSISRIIIKEGVTSIGDYAFCGVNMSRGVTIPESVVKIGEGALSGGKFTYIALPQNLQYISNGMMGGCFNLEKITIPENVNSIGDRAFINCQSLTEILISGNVTSIGDRAFGGCTDLREITIPKNVVSIGKAPFSACENLISIDVDERNTCYSSQDGNLFNKNKTEIIQYAHGNENAIYIIPKRIEKICDEAFEGNYKLKQLVIPESVKEICENAFNKCSNLKEIYYEGTEGQWNNITIAANGNNYLTGATMLYNKIISEDSDNPSINIKSENVYNIIPNAIPEGACIILALYKDGTFSRLQKAVYEGDGVKFTVYGEYDSVKVMCWDSLAGMKPLCISAEIK